MFRKLAPPQALACCPGPAALPPKSGPNAYHAEHTIAAARNGKHVICEKPMAVTLWQCQAMVEAVDRYGIKCAQGNSKAYDTPIQKIGEIMRSGELDQPIHIQTRNYNDWMIRALMPWVARQRSWQCW